MPRFFIDKDILTEESVLLTGDDAHHISRSLRMRAGEELTLCDGVGYDYHCTIEEIDDRTVRCAVHSKEKNRTEPPYRAIVFQGLAKGDRFDTVIQKSVECGAYEIVPVMTKRCTVKLTASDGAKKCARWNKIAEEAAKQCGRGIIPKVTEPISFDEAVKRLAELDLPLFCYEEGNAPIKAEVEAHPDATTIGIVIGPEGGFAEEEAAKMTAAGISATSLGRRILRTESAAPFVLACLSYAFED